MRFYACLMRSLHSCCTCYFEWVLLTSDRSLAMIIPRLIVQESDKMSTSQSSQTEDMLHQDQQTLVGRHLVVTRSLERVTSGHIRCVSETRMPGLDSPPGLRIDSPIATSPGLAAGCDRARCANPPRRSGLPSAARAGPLRPPQT